MKNSPKPSTAPRTWSEALRLIQAEHKCGPNQAAEIAMRDRLFMNLHPANRGRGTK